MAVDRKILERIEKLLRMAGPASGATEHEKQSAATEALKLFNEHDLVVRERERPKRRKQPQQTRQATSTPMSTVYEQPPPPSGYNPYFAGAYPMTRTAPRQMPGSEWVKSKAPYDTVCLAPDCGEPILQGEPVWARVVDDDIECMHADRTGSCEW